MSIVVVWCSMTISPEHAGARLHQTRAGPCGDRGVPHGCGHQLTELVVVERVIPDQEFHGRHVPHLGKRPTRGTGRDLMVIGEPRIETYPVNAFDGERRLRG